MKRFDASLYTNQKLKLLANNVYVYVIHLVHLLLNVLPGFMRVLLLRPVLGRCGKNVYIDHNVYIKFPWLVEIGDTVSINRGVEVYSDYFSKSIVKIGSGVRIAPNVKIHASGHELDSGEFLHSGEDIVIKDNVWIGAGAYILQGVVIGDGAVVAAGSVVTKNVPSKTLVAGVPAKVIRELKT
ncbi:sugar O-acetyltransferase [bacterium]|nr:sugar O-acetyltransferase [bacterium]